MKVDQKSRDRLVIVSRPWALTIGTSILGAAPIVAAFTDPEIESLAMRAFLLLLGLGVTAVAWRLMPFLTLDLDRRAGTVRVTHHRITGNSSFLLALDQIEDAMHLSSWSDSTRMERLALRTKDGPLPLEFGYFSTSRAPIIREINDWLKQADA